jgi:hypothetical protein
LAAINTTTTTDVTTSVSQGKQLVVDSQASTQTIGNFVTDVSAQPFIAPTIIGFYAYNMRPGQRYYIFFDSINVSQYCRPAALLPNTTLATLNTADPSQLAHLDTWGQPILSDAQGHVVGQFSIPGATFRTGERILEIADVDNIVLGNDALTSKAAASFTASNLNVSKQLTTLTTVNPVLSTQPVSNTIVTTTVSVEQTTIPDIVNFTATHEPIAQAMNIKTPTGEAGIFATSLDIYFKRKSLSANTGVTTYMCEVNNGYPDTSKRLPFSQVHLNYEDVVISEDASAPTKFKYESPIFLNNGKEYAFIVRPDNGDPDYFVYSANLGDIDIKSGIQVFSQPIIGTAYYGATETTWSPLPTEYIKFNLNRAQFSNAAGQAVFNNSSTDYLSVSSLVYSGTTAQLIPGDKVYQATSASFSTIDVTATGTLRNYDPVKQLLYVDNSTGRFNNNSIIQIHRFANSSLAATNAVDATTLIASAYTSVMYNPVVNHIVGEFATMTPAGTSLSFNYIGTSNTETTLPSQPITIGYETNFYDQERKVYSVSNRSNTLTITANLNSDSAFLSPVIDTVKADALIIRNLVDFPQYVYNEYFNNGQSRTKYISKPVTLANGQDAEDIQVILTAHRPVGTDVKVYVKFRNGEDPEPLNAKTWTPLFNQYSDLYSDPSNPNDFREFVFSAYGGYALVPLSGTITAPAYENDTETTSVITWSGSDSQFLNELQVGWYINMPATPTFSESAREIRALNTTGGNTITLNRPFTNPAGYTANAYYLVPPPTTAWLAKDTESQISGFVSTSTATNIINGLAVTFNAATGVNTDTDKITVSGTSDLREKDAVYYYVPEGSTAVGGLTPNNIYYIYSISGSDIILSSTPDAAAQIDLTGAGTGTHSFNTTNFTRDISPGTIVKINGDEQAVTAVTNATSLVVGNQWTAENAFSSRVPIYTTGVNGITYLNSTGANFTSFIQFQVKVILQSNDSSKVPLLDDLRVLALQL